jgi:hypothetical protein
VESGEVLSIHKPERSVFPRRRWLALAVALVAFAGFAPPIQSEEEPFFGLWNMAPGDVDGDLFLYRAVLRYRARASLRAAGMLPEAFRAREDSLNLRSDRFEDFLVLQDSLGLGWMPPTWGRGRARSELSRQITVDLDSSKVVDATLLQGKSVTIPVRRDLNEYLASMTRRSFRSIWNTKALEGLQKINDAGSGSGGLFNIPLPNMVPGSMRMFVGEGKPNLNVRGSERITFGGASRWNPDQPDNEFVRKQSKFPSLEMKQELNLQLTGTIGDKVSVNVDQSSQAQTPLSNNIRIHYKGYRDEIIQKVDLGNTSLQLPGTKYVTYSGQHQGLFGINTQAQVGDIEMTGILSKQEGKTETRSIPPQGGEIVKRTIDDYRYVRGKFFFLVDPDGPPMSNADALQLSSSLEVWKDDRIGRNNLQDGTIPAYVTLDGLKSTLVDSLRPDGDGIRHAETGDFQRLTIGQDYTVYTNMYVIADGAGCYPVLELDRTLDDDMTEAMAVSYSTGGGEPIGGRLGTSPDTLLLKLIRPAATMGGTRPTDLSMGVFAPAARLELRNVYDLGSRLSSEGLSVAVRRKGNVNGISNPDNEGGFTYIQILGLDLYTEAGGDVTVGPDGKIDRERIDYDRGYLMFRELQPFAPTRQDSFRMGNPPRPAKLRDLAPGIYLRNSWTQASSDSISEYQIDVTARSAVSTITLNAFNILNGSEVVTAGGRTLTRGSDYSIDYDTGEIQILDTENIRSTDDIRVSYSYVPFGAGSQKTLIGTGIRYQPQSSKLSLSTAWMYEGRGAPGTEGQRPRLGQEPTRTVVGEVIAGYKTDSWLLTSLVDALPGVRTNQKSNFAVEGNLGLSLPNPNTRNQLYIDDFEGAKDVVSIQMNRAAWRPSSIPRGVRGASELDKMNRRGECWWYSPRSAVKEGDLQPAGALAETEKDNNRQILELHYFPRTIADTTSWFSLVQVLSEKGTDMSRAQFIDIWVNDFHDWNDRAARQGKVHVDIGVVSENAIWQRVIPDDQPGHLNDPAFSYDAVGQLDSRGFNTEDFITADGQLDLGSGRDEDVGLDAKPDASEGSGPDPANDNWSFEEGSDDGIRDVVGLGDRNTLNAYAKINGTEKNGRLDTEDLNGDSRLDTAESFFTMTADLADESLVESESGWERDGSGGWNRAGGLGNYGPYTRGWRRIRIPLTPKYYNEVDRPTWEQVRHMRIWLDGFTAETRLQIGGIEITGNRWLKGTIRPDRPDSSFALAPGEEFFPAVLNNKDNSSAEYFPPFSPKETKDVSEREQSLTLEMRSFQPNHVGVVYRTFAASQDFASLYKTLEFYTNQRIRDAAPPESLVLFVRFSRNITVENNDYYEFRTRLNNDGGWALNKIDLAELSQLPTARDTTKYRWFGNGTVISRKGNPSLTSVQRITFGVINVATTPVISGNVWIDELRLTSVKRDTGVASQISLNANLADLGSLSVGVSQKDADFLSIGSDRGSGRATTGISTSARMNLEKFIEGTGLKIPINYSLTSNRQVPKFSTNSDLVLRHATDRDITQSQSKDFSFNLSRSRSTNPFLRYTIDAMSLSGRFGSNVLNTPDARDTTTSRSGSVQYSLPIQGGPPIRIYKNTNLHLLPTNLAVGMTGSVQREKEVRRKNGDLDSLFVRSRDLTTKTGTMNWSTGLRPIDAVTYSFDQSRDLRLQPVGTHIPYIGTEVSRRHQLSANQSIRLFRGTFNPKASWNGSFDGRFNQLQTGAGGLPERSNNFNNSSTLTFSGSLPLDRIVKRIASIGSGGGGPKGNPPENGKGGGEEEKRPGDGEKETGEPPPDEGVKPDDAFPGGYPDSLGLEPGRGTEPERGVPSSTPTRGKGRDISNVFSIGGMSATYTLGSTNSTSMVSGTPSLGYQLGLSRDPGPSIQRLHSFNPSFGSGDRKDFNLATEVKLLSEIRIGMTYQWGTTKSLQNGGGTNTKSTKFPDLDVNWGRIHQRLGIQKFAKDVRASSRYSREMHETGSSSSPNGKDRVETTVTFRPLLNLDATLNSGISTKLMSSYSSSKLEQFSGTHSFTFNRNRQLQIRLQRAMTLSRMVTNPLTKKKSKVSSKLDLSVTLDLSDDKSESGPAGNIQVLRDQAKVGISTSAGYNITTNVTGNAALSVGQDSDRKNRTRTSRYVTVSVTAAFNF